MSVLRPYALACAVKPHPSAAGFAVVRSNLPAQGDKGLPFHTYEIAELGALPPGGRLLDTPIWNSVLRVGPVAPFADGALDYSGVRAVLRGGCSRAGTALHPACSGTILPFAGRRQCGSLAGRLWWQTFEVTGPTSSRPSHRPT